MRNIDGTSRLAVGLVAAVLVLAGCAADPATLARDPVGRAQAAATSGAVATFAAGTLIVPMDTTYQDFGMLQAFGLVYQLLLNDVPIHWVIRPGKAYGGVDFTASAVDLQSGAPIVAHGYRGGPFVIEATDAAAALPIITAWQATRPNTKVHRATAPFSGYVKVRLVAAPNIAMFADGNQDIARGYVGAAGIPDSTGNLLWPNTSPDMLDVVEVGGPTTTSHSDGALFDADGDPVYCQMMSMHWAVTDANRPDGREVVAEYRQFLQHPVHLFAECQAVNAIENNVNGHFLTPNGFNIGNRPGSYDFYNGDQPFSQLDGAFLSVGGSEASYSLPGGDSYLGTDIVFISGSGDPAGVRDVWMTGYVTGACSILSEFCDPTLPQGKVSYLGGHQYDTRLPISTNPMTNGTRLFLNSLFEAPCATDRGQPSVSAFKYGPATTDSATVTYTITFANGGPGVAMGAFVEDVLAPGVSFVSATAGGTWDGTRVRWDVGNLGNGETGSVSVTVTYAAFGTYDNSVTVRYRSGNTPKSIVSNTATTCYHPVGDASGCTGTPDPMARACDDGRDNDGDGLVDFPGDPGCHSANDNDETDVAASTTDIRARTLIVFDTSGSMNWNTCTSTFTGGDGSTECAGADVACATCGAGGCGNGVADDSRIHQARLGISDAVLAYGEVEWSLMRFHQIPLPFRCPNFNANWPSGGWQGAGAAPCGGGFNSGDLVVGFHQDNSADLREWMDGQSNYGAAPPPGRDYELRGTGNTPLAGSLGSALTYLSAESGIDPVASCRPYVVILLTDGQETCSGDAPAAAAALNTAGFPVYVIGFAVADPGAVADLNAIALNGGTTSAIFVTDSAALSAAISGIVGSTVLTELCNGIDDDCDGDIDEGFRLYCNVPGGVSTASLCADPGETVCDGVDDNCNGLVDEGLLNACGGCGAPPPEICDGIDNDCDGPIDEGDVCLCSATPEICDGVDNDCDGSIDEDLTRPCSTDVGECTIGVETCVGGAYTACSGVGPAPETCDGADNDCDGTVDGLTRTCGTDEGACEFGAQICLAGAYGPCVGGVGPTTEICDTRDNDCNGSTDEGNPGGGAPCGTTTGVCLPGITTCVGGVLVCAGGVEPSPELCNTLDDDCDGLVDEGNPEGGTSCGATGVGECDLGALVCSGGVLICVGETGPTSEVCDGLDNDCDGMTDEGDPGGGAACGETLGECTPGTIHCVGGVLVCDAIGPTAEVCDGLDNDCDGVVDDGLSVGAPCGSDVGECSPGVFICRSGVPTCEGALGPLPEVCDLLDNDCDSMVDEDLPAGGSCGTDVGMCEAGTFRCVDGRNVCVGEVPPAPEACDCEDNDCDGPIDENPETLCPAGSACVDCECVLPCSDSEFNRCPSGRVPEDRDGECFCVPLACDAEICPTETVSDEMGTVLCAPDDPDHPVCECLSNRCTYPCDGVDCADPLVCHPRAARCVENDCRGLGCPSGLHCNVTTLECVEDPCATAMCGSDEACRAGACEASCATVSCEAGERCVRGVCRNDPCLGVSCGPGEVCTPTDGRCVDDPCAGRSCEPGMVCDPMSGVCVEEPCSVLRCPDGQRCVAGECELSVPMVDAGPGSDAGVFDGGAADPEERILATGGCTCRVDRGSEEGRRAAPLFALLCAALLFRRRRRR